MLAGITMSPIPKMEYDLLYGERTAKTVANATRIDPDNCYAAEVPLKPQVEVFPLTEVNRALQLLKHGNIIGAAVARVSSK